MGVIVTGKLGAVSVIQNCTCDVIMAQQPYNVWTSAARVPSVSCAHSCVRRRESAAPYRTAPHRGAQSTKSTLVYASRRREQRNERHYTLLLNSMVMHLTQMSLCLHIGSLHCIAVAEFRIYLTTFLDLQFVSEELQQEIMQAIKSISMLLGNFRKF